MMNKQTQFTFRDFEDKARELMTIAYALTEQRFHVNPRRKPPVWRVMQEAVVCLQAAIDTFRFIFQVPD